MNAFDYYIGLSEKDKGLARGRDGRRQFLEMGMGFWEMETWLGWQGRAAISTDMALFILPNGAGVRDSCLRAMVLRLVDSRNLFVNTGGDRAIVNVYSTNFHDLLDEIDLWLFRSRNSSVNMVYRRFVSSYNDLFIWVTLGELPEEAAFKRDVWDMLRTTGHIRLDGPAAAYDIEIRFAYENRTGWTDAALVFTVMYHEFLVNGFYDIKTVEIERAKIEEEVANEFCGRCVNYIYDETGEKVDTFVQDFFGTDLYGYIKRVADFNFEWELGKHLPEVNVLGPMYDGGYRMSVNPSDDEDVAERAKEIATAIASVYLRHWSGEIALPAHNQPRLLEVSNE